VANHLQKLKLKLWDSGFFGNENWTGGFGFKPPTLHLDFWEIFEVSGQMKRGGMGLKSQGFLVTCPGLQPPIDSFTIKI
jgi:hypothetical protein